MAQINTYHCLCTSLLLSTTHTLSSLPIRQSNNSVSDNAIILPLPSSPPSLSSSQSQTNNGKAPESNSVHTIPPAGYSILLGLQADSKTTIIRREDGFEKRVLYKCGRCGVVVGYGIASETPSEEMDMDNGQENAGTEEVYKGKILYILPGGVMSTEVMSKGGAYPGGEGGTERKIGENDLDIVGRKGVGVFE
jgi:hypothetical protein